MENQKRIRIPYNFEPRDYQYDLLKAIDSGYKRALCVWHRRAGKDKVLINIIASKMVEKVGSYYYFFPTYSQGQKILWEGIDKDGFKFLDHIPKEIRKRVDNSSMTIELKNGSIFRIIGTDNVDSVVGTNPIGCVFSEYALQDPRAWGYIRPILAENEGFAIFNYTSRGRNHGYTLLEYAKNKKDEWFISILPATETSVFTPEQLESERDQYISEDGDDLRFRQEYLCSFDGAIQGSYYGKILQQLREKGHFANFVVEDYPVQTWWDLGMNDMMSIWFTQIIGNEIRVIDYYENNGEGLSFYAGILRDKGYKYDRHFAPHDIEVKELGTGISRKDKALDFGIRFDTVPKTTLEDGIQAVRSVLPQCYFREEQTEVGVNCLMNYHKEYDEKNKVYKNHPKHDWSSHGADAFRTFAVGYKHFLYSRGKVYNSTDEESFDPFRNDE